MTFALQTVRQRSFLSKCLLLNENFARDSPLLELTNTDYQPPLVYFYVSNDFCNVCGVIHCDVGY